MNDGSLVMPGAKRILLPSGVTAPSAPPPLSARPRMQFSEGDDDRKMAKEALGDLDDIEILFNEVLLLKYIREDLSPNIVASAQTQREDQWQGGVGLVLKVGPRAFKDDPENRVFFHGVTVNVGDWVSYRISDGWDRGVQELYGYHQFADCVMVQDAHIRLRLKYPGRVMALGR